MDIQTHLIGQTKIAEVISDEILIKAPDDVLELLGILDYLEIYKVIIQEQILTPDFLTWKMELRVKYYKSFRMIVSGLPLLEILKKYTGKSIRAFIFESNKGNQVNFVNSLQEGLTKLAE